MKKVSIVVICLLVAGLTYLAIEGNKLQEITTEIEILATPEKVWKVLININDWRNWSPSINESQGVAKVGSSLTITMVGKEQVKTVQNIIQSF